VSPERISKKEADQRPAFRRRHRISPAAAMAMPVRAKVEGSGTACTETL
jgi:hypothetical protein